MSDEEREDVKYRRIWHDLRRDIQSGRWKVGQRIPSEPELADTFGVSRGTVRNAIEQLVNNQMLRKEQGRGTFVISSVPRLQKSLDWLASFTEQLRESGIKPSTDVLEAGVRISFAHEVIRVAAAGAEEAALLEIAPGDPVVIRDRISADQDEYPFEVLHSVDRGDRFEYRYRILGDSTWMRR